MQTFGQNLTKSMYRLSKDLGIPEDALSRYKLGKTTPTLPVARLLAKDLGVPLDDLHFPAEDVLDKRKPQADTI